MMLLRSASSPILGSPLSSSSPHFNESSNFISPSSTPHHKPSLSCHLSPPSGPSPVSFARSRSDGNLHSLISPDHRPNHFNHNALDYIPSFSLQCSNGKEFDGERRSFSLKETDNSCRNSFAGPLFLARGLGVDRRGEVDRGDENYCKRTVEENHSAALFFAKYAQLLYKANGDKERASSYFVQAVRSTPRDSNVLAAFANFLWETDEDDGDGGGYDGAPRDYFEALFCHEILA